MRLCPRCTRPVALEVRLCRSCLDEGRPLARLSPVLSVLVAVAEAEGRGVDVVKLCYVHLRARDAAWRARQEADLEAFRREHGPALAARRYLEARARGEKLTAREAGSPWRVKAPAVRMRASRLRRNALRETATDPSAECARAAS